MAKSKRLRGSNEPSGKGQGLSRNILPATARNSRELAGSNTQFNRPRDRIEVPPSKPLAKKMRAAIERAASRSYRPTLGRLIAFVWIDCPVGALARAQRSNDWCERAAIARHPKTPGSTLANLARDSNPVVRALAIANLAGRAP